MPDTTKQSPTADTGTLVQGVVNDAGKLIEQQFQLLRTEFSQEFDKARTAALALGTGVGLVALGSLFGALATVRFLHETTGLPMWMCYAAVGTLSCAGGAGLLATGTAEAARINLLPEQTRKSLRENVGAVNRVFSEAGA